MKQSKLVLGFGVLALFATAAPMALAAPPPPPPPVGGEITVTALRTATNIQKTPVAVTAFSGQGLQNQNFQSFVDITRIAPAVRFVGQGNVDASNIQMRGLGTPPVGTGGPAVQIYENDFNLQGFSQNVPTYDVANIQVLKGPQGTLFGRNTLGGAILYNTVQPSYVQNGYLQASYGNYNYWAIEGAGNATVIPDVLAVRVAGQIRRRDGYIRSIARDFNSTLGYGSTLDKLANVKTDSFRVSLLFTPTPRFKNTLTFEYFHGDETGTPTIPVNQNPGGPFGPFDPGFFPFTQAESNILNACNHQCVDYGVNNNIYVKRDHYTLMNTTTYEITPDLTLKNIAGYRTTKDNFAITAAGSPSQFVNSNSFNPTDTYSEELQLQGHSFDRFHWILGGYYQHVGYGGGPDGSGFAPAFTPTATVSETKAIFFNLDTDLTSKLKLHTGVRYTWDNQTVCAVGVIQGNEPLPGSQTCALAAIATPGTAAGIIKQSASAPTWVVGLDYQARDNLFFYVTSRRGYRSGGVNTPVFNTPCTTGHVGGTVDSLAAANAVASPGHPLACPDFGFLTTGVHSGVSVDLRPFQLIAPEYVTDIEVGMRSNWMMGDWRTRFNIQYFHYTYDNVATLVQVGTGLTNVLAANEPADPGFGSIAVNGGTVTADGVEGDLTVNPTRDLTLDLNASWFDQKQSGPTVLPASFASFPASLVNLPTPKWALTASVNYVLPWHPLDGALVVNYNYFYTTSYQAQNIVVPGYDLHSARVSWNDIAHTPISAAFFINNIFDRRYEMSAVALFLDTVNYGEPRMFGVDLSVKFH